MDLLVSTQGKTGSEAKWNSFHNLWTLCVLESYTVKVNKIQNMCECVIVYNIH